MRRRPRITLPELRRPLPWGPPPQIAKNPQKDRAAMAKYLVRSWLSYRRSQGVIADD
jgi:hypothetical protein